MSSVFPFGVDILFALLSLSLGWTFRCCFVSRQSGRRECLGGRVLLPGVESFLLSTEHSSSRDRDQPRQPCDGRRCTFCQEPILCSQNELVCPICGGPTSVLRYRSLDSCRPMELFIVLGFLFFVTVGCWVRYRALGVRKERQAYCFRCYFYRSTRLHTTHTGGKCYAFRSLRLNGYSSPCSGV